MSTIKRVVLCVALLNAAANGLRFGDRALDPREDVDCSSGQQDCRARRDEDLHVRSVIAAAAPRMRGRWRHRRAVETLTLESRAPTALRRGKRR